MKSIRIFITYNPNISAEQVLAVRLHTIGAVNGFLTQLPDRYNSETILDDETKTRIKSSNYVILFSLSSKLSNIVKEEIEYAFSILQDRSKIIVIYNQKKNLAGKMTDHFTEILYDPTAENAHNDVIKKILDTINIKQQIEERKVIQKQQQQIKALEATNSSNNALIAFLSIGLGLAILSNLSEKNEPKKRKK